MENIENTEVRRSHYPHMQPFNVTPRKKDGKRSVYPKKPNVKKEGK